MRLARLTLLGSLALALACKSAPAPLPPPPPLMQQPPAPPPKPRIALVLGGGAARGFAHVGVIRALEQEHIPIDLVVGTSVGSLIGALYASNLDSFDLEWTAFKLEKDDLFDFGVVTAVMGMGFARGDRLEQFVRSRTKAQNIEDLRIPFAAVATDLNWGTEVVLDRGSLARAVRASSAIPGVFQPVQLMGKLLVDGGVVDNIPVSVARAKGADIVIASDISEDVANTRITNLLDVTMQATNIMFALNAEHSKRDADVIIAPAVGAVAMLDFTQKKQCMQAGIEAAHRAAPAIRKAIDGWVAARQEVRPARAVGP
ncbi:patatin-like phospholipase family protein [Anaeromyxobacter diazotrophicus]|uniref:Putative NTE family protein YlbK n=1 Tax=Anaeromyxobacter diazotrophicus TaxID=2590199 RepID=A0A7I9VRG4_9BACT|nr:patatin-like phospholipase family protein [Anaeromyxobacter diazotrophicus]GEJ58690.1 putative NTE family protein YlbK [Anaeromyxobacter diazotrophicus]